MQIIAASSQKREKRKKCLSGFFWGFLDETVSGVWLLSIVTPPHLDELTYALTALSAFTAFFLNFTFLLHGLHELFVKLVKII